MAFFTLIKYLKYISSVFFYVICCFFVSNAQVNIWETNYELKTSLLKERPVKFFTYDSINSETNLISIDSTIEYQVMDGFGATMTGSSAYVLNEMSSSAREEALNSLFSEEGIRINFIRHTIGASDFNKKSSYSYCDTRLDTRLRNFSISKDKEYLIPMLKKAIEKNNNTGICIMGSPWSAPFWMKTSETMNGGYLNQKYEGVYADYLIKYIMSFQKEGIPIYAITIQNEPNYSTTSYPSMNMSEEQTIRFVKDNLGPKFQYHGIWTKIIVFDHNWEDYQYPIEVLNDNDAKKYIAGSAFHAYKGWYTSQSLVHNAHPDKGIWFTEQTGHGNNYFNPGGWSYDLYWSARNLFIGSIRNWSKCVLQWNIALDKYYGPKNGGCSDCRGLITIDGDNFYKEPEYYSVGHFSKFVDRGAKRIESNSTNSSINNVAFKNPDGSTVLVVLPEWNSDTTEIRIKLGDSVLTDTLIPRTLKTYKWGGDPDFKYIGVSENKSIDNIDFKVFPNPTNSELNILNVNNEIKEIIISDIHGKIVYKNQEKFEKNITIDVEFLNKGIYFVNLISEDVYLTKKVVIN